MKGGKGYGGDFLKDMKKAWEKFIQEGLIQDKAVRPIIQQSWQRCKQYKLDYKNGRGRRASSKKLKEIMSKNKELLKVARPIMENLQKFVYGSGFIIILTDDEGYIIESIGDEKIKEEAERMNFSIGALWTEEEVGTNAIGLCIKENKPIQVIGAEHYCETHHPWTCSAAPIHDDKGNLIGVLDMSGSCHKAHKHTLGIVVAAAYSIENELSLLKSHELIATTVNSISEGMIMVDKNYKINMVNHVAERILGVKRGKIIGRDLRSILKDVVFEDILSMKSSCLEKTDCDFIVGSNRITCNVKITPVKTGSQPIGMVIMFREMKYLHNTINIVTGNKATYTFDDILTKNDKMKKTIKDAKKFARTRGCVLIEGESGTGKELFAHSIHNYSNRKDGPFVAVNCASIPRDLVESELFGYERGAFTGAAKEGKPGKFELANGGTIFLDEIGELPLDLQAKLLRVLDSYTITRIGGKYGKKLDVRVVCATNRKLLEEVKRKNFREDLYFRLNVFKLSIPPLRERKEDIKLYINYFVNRLNNVNFIYKRVSASFIAFAENYIWRGNVRELENVVERAYYLCDDNIITEKYLPDEIRYYKLLDKRKGQDNNQPMSIEEAEKQTIINALLYTKGHVIEAGKKLNMSKSTIYRKINKYNIDVNQFRQIQSFPYLGS